LNRTLLISFVVGGVLVVLIGAGAGAYFAVNHFRGQGALQRAEEAYADGRWHEAKHNYTWYIVRHPDDLSVMPNYVDACLRIVKNRAATVRDASRAYLRWALQESENVELAQKTIAFHRKHRLWPELDYAVEALLRHYPDAPFLKVAQAVAHERLGRAGQAVTAYRKLINAGRATPECYGNVATLLREQGLETQATDLIQSAILDAGQPAEVQAHFARYLLDAGDGEAAVAEIEEALAGGADSGEAFLIAAQVYARQKAWEKVLQYAEQAAQLLPDDWETHLLYVQALLSQGKRDRAIAYLSGLPAQTLADSPELLMVLAEEQVDDGDFDGLDETVAMFEAAYPERRPVFEYIEARKLMAAGRPADAVGLFERVIEQAPSLQVARYFLSGAYLETGQRDLARSTLETYMKNNPRDERAQLLFDANFATRTAAEQKRSAQALLDTPNLPSGTFIANARILTRDVPPDSPGREEVVLARQLLERAIAASPKSPDGYVDLGFLLLQHGRVEEAGDVLQRAAGAGVDAGAIDRLRAAVAIEQGETDRATELFRANLESGSLDGREAVRWADLLADRGGTDRAQAWIALAREFMGDETDSLELDLARARLRAQAGNFEEARDAINAVAAAHADEPAAVRRVNDQRIALARMMLANPEGGEAAEALLKDVAQTQPDRVETYVLRARMRLNDDPPDLDAAIELAELARDARPDDVEALLLSCDVAVELGRLNEAIAFATDAFNEAPYNLAAADKLARLQLQSRRFAGAVITLEDVHDRFPGNTVVMQLLARAYAGDGRYTDAEQIMQALEEEQGVAPDPVLRGQMLLGRGSYDEAEQALREAYEKDPQNLTTVQPLVVALVRRGRLDEAESFLRKLVEERSDAPKLWNELGDFYLAREMDEKLPDASSAYTRVLALRPNDPRALRGLVEVQMRSGNSGAALGLCERLLERNPDDVDTLAQKARLLMNVAGRQQEALDTVARALENEQRPIFYFMRGYLQLALGEYAPAIEDLQRYRESGGDAPSNLDAMLAEAYLGLGNRELAQAYYEAALADVDADSPSDQARLARVAGLLERQGGGS